MNVVQRLLSAWREKKALNALDCAFVEFLLRKSPSDDPLLCAIAAFASAQLAQGHTALLLTALCSNEQTAMFNQSFYERAQHDVRAVIFSSFESELLPEPRALFRLYSFEAARACLLSSDWVSTAEADDGASPLVLEGEFLYLRRYFVYETFVAQAFKRLQSLRFPVPDWAHQALFDIFSSLSHDSKTVHWQALAAALCLRSGLTVLTGGPGTGKTTTVVRVLALLQSLNLHFHGKPLVIRLVAPTGKAASRLQESMRREREKLSDEARVLTQSSMDVLTLHRLLGASGVFDAFIHGEQTPLALDVLVIDEASMISLPMMAQVLAALPRGARLILLGDRDQLSPVEAGAVFGQLCPDDDGLLPNQWACSLEVLAYLNGFSKRLGAKPVEAVVEDLFSVRDIRADYCLALRVSRRFTAESDIGQLARAVKLGDVHAVNRVFAHGHQVQKVETWAHIQAHVVSFYRDYFSLAQQTVSHEIQDDWAKSVLALAAKFQLLSTVHLGELGVVDLNEKVETTLRAEGIVSGGDWFVGRLVMVQKNDYALGLMNGDIGVALWWQDATAHYASGVRVAFLREEGEVRWVLPSRLSHVETVFAMTVHKSQGSEFDEVVLVLPEQGQHLVTREWIYTGLTRARERFVLWSPTEHWVHSIRVQQSQVSGLAQRLLSG